MYRSIDTALWTDPKVKRLSPEGKLLFLYLITNRHAHVSGIYTLPSVLIAHETGLSDTLLDTLFDTLADTKLAFRDTQYEVIWVVNMLRRQASGGRIKIAVEHQLATLHGCPLVRHFIMYYKDMRLEYSEVSPTLSDTLSPTLSDTLSDTLLHRPSSFLQEQEQEQRNTKTNPNTNTARATRTRTPEVEEQVAVPGPRQKSPPTPPTFSPGFLAWWEAYPHDRRVSKTACYTVWVAQDLEPRTDELVEKLERLKHTRWQTEERRFVKTSLPYLNAGQHDDDLMPLDVVQQHQVRERLSDREYKALLAGKRFEEHICGATGRSPVSRSDDDVIDHVQYRAD